MNPRSTTLAAAAALFASASLTQAAPITDPTLYSTIDPLLNGVDVTHSDVTGSAPDIATPLSTLNGLSSLNVIQDWTGFIRHTDQGGAGQIIAFTNASLPDIKIISTGGNPNIALFTPTNDKGTSQNTGIASDSLLLQRSSGTTNFIQFDIDFGSWDGSTFDGTVNSVSAAGFTIPQFSTSNANNDITVKFFDASNTLLSTQFADGTSIAGQNWYFGHQSTSANISRIEVVVGFSNSAHVAYFDDLGFTAIPEPASMALLALGGLMMLPWRRRA